MQLHQGNYSSAVDGLGPLNCELSRGLGTKEFLKNLEGTGHFGVT